MKSGKLIRAAAVTITSAGLILPQSVALAAAPQEQEPALLQKAETAIADVTLAAGGTIRGQVVDAQGQPVADAHVSVVHDGKTVAGTKTSADGTFAVRGLRGGAHVVMSGEHGGVYRMWAPETAPPSARPGIMIVRGSAATRGQNGWMSGKGLLMAGALGGIVAGGVISQGNDHDDNGVGSGS
jgi:hypothetical protein